MKKQNSMFNLFKIGLLMALASSLFTACDKEKEPIPGYLTLQPFTLKTTDPSVHGSISQKITHARISLLDPVDSTTQLVGMFELPTTVPVLAEGDKTAFIDAVIKSNGSSLYLEPYPFYSRYYGSVKITPGEDVEINPETTYKDGIKFVFIEDFENAGHFFENDQDGNTNTFVQSSQDNVLEGNHSGKIVLDSANTIAVVATNDPYTLDYTSAVRIFLELDYKTPVPIEFGLQSVDNISGPVSIFEFVILAKDDWNKIYLDLTDLVASAAPTNKFHIIFRTYIPSEDGELTMDRAEVFLDNIKLIHF